MEPKGSHCTSFPHRGLVTSKVQCLQLDWAAMTEAFAPSKGLQRLLPTRRQQMLRKALAIHLQPQVEKMHRPGWALQKRVLRCAHADSENTKQVCWPFSMGLPRERGREKRQLTVLFPSSDSVNRLLTQQALGLDTYQDRRSLPLAKRQQEQRARVPILPQRCEEGDPSISQTTETALAPLPRDKPPDSHAFSPTVCPELQGQAGKIMDGDLLALRTCSSGTYRLPPHLPSRH